MNKIYRIVWNVESGQWVVASEMAKGRKKAGAAKIGATLLSVVGLTLVGPAAFAGTLVNCPGTGANQGYGSDGANGGGAWGVNSNYAGCNSSVTNTGIVLNELNNSTLPQANTAGITVGQTKYNAAGTVWVYGPKGIKLEGATTTTGLATFNLGADMTGDKIVNVGAGSIASGSGDAVNGSQLYGSNVAIAAAFGGGSTVDANGYVTKPSYALTKANTITGNTGPYTNVGSALTEVDTALGALNTRANTPMSFTADSAAAVTRQLGDTLAIKGGNFAGAFSTTNVKTETDPTNGAITIKMADAPTFTGQIAANGGLVVGASQAIDMGGNKVTNVAAGTAATDAVNKGQLDAAAKWSLQANGGTVKTVTSADTINVVDGTNTKASFDSTTNKLKVDVVDAPTFAGKITANGGLTVGASQTIDMGANKVTNVAAGTATTDAVNVGQLKAVSDAGMNFAGNSGTNVARKVGDTLAIKGLASTAGTYSGNNLKTTTDTTTGTINVQMADAPKFGTVTINDSGKISGLAAGTANADAVNVSQLKGVTDAFGGGATVNTDGTIKAPSYDVAGTSYSNVGDALDALGTQAASPITFAGNTGSVDRTLGQPRQPHHEERGRHRQPRSASDEDRGRRRQHRPAHHEERGRHHQDRQPHHEERRRHREPRPAPDEDRRRCVAAARRRGWSGRSHDDGGNQRCRPEREAGQDRPGSDHAVACLHRQARRRAAQRDGRPLQRAGQAHRPHGCDGQRDVDDDGFAGRPAHAEPRRGQHRLRERREGPVGRLPACDQRPRQLLARRRVHPRRPFGRRRCGYRLVSDIKQYLESATPDAAAIFAAALVFLSTVIPALTLRCPSSATGSRSGTGSSGTFARRRRERAGARFVLLLLRVEHIHIRTQSRRPRSVETLIVAGPTSVIPVGFLCLKIQAFRRRQFCVGRVAE